MNKDVVKIGNELIGRQWDSLPDNVKEKLLEEGERDSSWTLLKFGDLAIKGNYVSKDGSWKFMPQNPSIIFSLTKEKELLLNASVGVIPEYILDKEFIDKYFSHNFETGYPERAVNMLVRSLRYNDIGLDPVALEEQLTWYYTEYLVQTASIYDDGERDEFFFNYYRRIYKENHTLGFTIYLKSLSILIDKSLSEIAERLILHTKYVIDFWKIDLNKFKNFANLDYAKSRLNDAPIDRLHEPEIITISKSKYEGKKWSELTDIDKRILKMNSINFHDDYVQLTGRDLMIKGVSKGSLSIYNTLDIKEDAVIVSLTSIKDYHLAGNISDMPKYLFNDCDFEKKAFKSAYDMGKYYELGDYILRQCESETYINSFDNYLQSFFLDDLLSEYNGKSTSIDNDELFKYLDDRYCQRFASVNKSDNKYALELYLKIQRRLTKDAKFVNVINNEIRTRLIDSYFNVATLNMPTEVIISRFNKEDKEYREFVHKLKIDGVSNITTDFKPVAISTINIGDKVVINYDRQINGRLFKKGTVGYVGCVYGEQLTVYFDTSTLIRNKILNIPHKSSNLVVLESKDVSLYGDVLISLIKRYESDRMYKLFYDKCWEWLDKHEEKLLLDNSEKLDSNHLKIKGSDLAIKARLDYYDGQKRLVPYKHAKVYSLGEEKSTVLGSSANLIKDYWFNEKFIDEFVNYNFEIGKPERAIHAIARLQTEIKGCSSPSKYKKELKYYYTDYLIKCCVRYDEELMRIFFYDYFEMIFRNDKDLGLETLLDSINLLREVNRESVIDQFFVCAIDALKGVIVSKAKYGKHPSFSYFINKLKEVGKLPIQDKQNSNNREPNKANTKTLNMF